VGRPCSVCVAPAPDRARIEEELIAGKGFRAISRQSRQSRDSIRRHAAAHLPQRLAHAEEAERVAGDDLLARLSEIEAEARRLGQKAESTGDLRAALQAVRELTRLCELVARLRGEIREGMTINLFQAPEWISVQRRVLDALAGYPEARFAVARALLPAGSSDA
jgi:hypothetical protein